MQQEHDFIDGVVIETADPAPDAQVLGEQQQLQLQRADDYAAHSLANPDVVEANVGAVNASLIRIGVYLADASEVAIEVARRDPEKMAQAFRVIDTYLRATRQIDRFAQFEQRAAATRRAAAQHAVATAPSVITSEVVSVPVVAKPEESEEIAT